MLFPCASGKSQVHEIPYSYRLELNGTCLVRKNRSYFGQSFARQKWNYNDNNNSGRVVTLVEGMQAQAIGPLE